MTIATAQLFRLRRAVLGWSVGAVALSVLTAAVYPSVRGQQSFEEMVDGLSPTVKALFGLDAGSILSPSGYLQGRLFASLLPLLLVALAIVMGNRLLAAAERDGTLELVAAAGVARSTIGWQSWGALCAIVAIVAVAAGGTLAVLAGPTGLADGVTQATVWQMVAAVAALAVVHGTLALAVGAATGSPATASLVAGTVAVAGHTLSGLADLADGARWVATVLPWHWYRTGAAVADGVDATAIVPTVALTLVAAAAGIDVFRRRDLRPR